MSTTTAPFAPLGMLWACYSCSEVTPRAGKHRCGRLVTEQVPRKPSLTDRDRELLAAVENGTVWSYTNGASIWLGTPRRIGHRASGLRRRGLIKHGPVDRLAPGGLALIWELTELGLLALRPYFPAWYGEQGPCPRCGGDYGPIEANHPCMPDICLTCGFTTDETARLGPDPRERG